MSMGKKIELSEFTCKPCRGRGGFEFVPKGKHALNLAEACLKLRKAGADIEAESPYLAIVKFRGARVTIFRSGKALVKGVKEEGKAREIAAELLCAVC